MWARNLFRFCEIQSKEVTTSRAKMKEETVREKFGILCRDSSRFTQHIMIFSLGTTASRYRRLHNHATPRYFLCDHIGYTIDHYFTTCSLVFLYTSFNEEGMVSSAKLKRCRFSGSTDKKTKVRWNAIHVCRFVLSFLAIFRADDALTTRFFKNDSLRIRCVLD